MAQLSIEEVRSILRVWLSELGTGAHFMTGFKLTENSRPENFKPSTGIYPAFRFKLV